MQQKWRILFTAIMINYIHMEKQQKISKFMKPIKPGEIFDSSDLDLESFENNQGKLDKKQPMLITFLNKFNQPDIEAMEKYIEAHKYLLELPVKSKITLFEDIIIIHEFRKELSALKNDRDRVKTIEAISERLQSVIKRTKMTIKERITKKLAHCSLEDVLQAMKNKKDLTFDKKTDKTKKINQISSNSNQDMQNPLIKKQSSHQEIEMNDMKKQSSRTEHQIDSSKQTKIMDSTFKSLSNNRLYRYGTKNIKQRIYIYANSITKEILPFNESNFKELKAKFQTQLPFQPKNIDVPMQVEENLEKKNQLNHESNQNNSASKIAEEQLETYIQAIKEKACQVLNESASNQSQKELAKYLSDIQQLQSKLASSKNLRQEEDMSAEQSEDRNAENNAKKGQNNSTGKKTMEEEKQTPRKEIDEALEQRKILYKLSNNDTYLNLVKQNPSRYEEFAWEEDEDNILYSFKFNPEAYRAEMACLLRYKAKELVMDRMNFLKLDLNLGLIDQINQLEAKPIEYMNPVVQEKMEIE